MYYHKNHLCMNTHSGKVLSHSPRFLHITILILFNRKFYKKIDGVCNFFFCRKSIFLSVHLNKIKEMILIARLLCGSDFKLRQEMVVQFVILLRTNRQIQLPCNHPLYWEFAPPAEKLQQNRGIFRGISKGG